MSNQAPGTGELEPKDKKAMNLSQRGYNKSAAFSRSRSLLTTVMVATAVVAVPTAAFAKITAKVERSCKRDYQRFCSKYSIGTTALRKCMESNGRRLSRKCYRALVDAGEVPRRLRKKRRR